jgi:hypothetical protein
MWDSPGFNSKDGQVNLSASKHSDWLWGLLSFLFNEYWGFFGDKADGV